MKKYRIFLVLGGQASTVQNSSIWLKNIYDSLVAIGNDVFLFDIDSYAAAKGCGFMSKEAKEVISNELIPIFINEHNKKPFDLFFSYLHSHQIYPNVLLEIKRFTRLVNYTTNFHQFDLFKEIAQIADINIFISKQAQNAFNQIGLNNYWMPLASNNQFYRRSIMKSNDIVFIGSAYGNRPYLFWRLLQYSIDLKIYGPGWIAQDSKTLFKENLIKKVINKFFSRTLNHKFERVVSDSLIYSPHNCYAELNKSILKELQGNFPNNLFNELTDKEYVNKLSNAGIVVNIQESRFNHDFNDHRVLFASNLRDFETTMCGTFLCTQYSNEIEELFEIGREIICYHNEHDLADKLKWYSNNISIRDRIAYLGHLKTLNCHTWEKRFSDFFRFAGF